MYREAWRKVGSSRLVSPAGSEDGNFTTAEMT
jgi:hypothetical protein